MGQIDMDEMGAECSGFVARIGPDVKSLQVGDRVVAQAFGAFSTRARTREIFTSKIAPDMELHEAAALPIVFSTAVYAIKVARLSAGDTVLIHCAAGGLGQALVMLCKTRGASVYITVGTSSKKKFMMDEYGIAEERIFTSRDASFQEGVMHATGGVGVDVVFNSLSGDLLRDTWECIAPFGRFVELGKRDFAINARLEMAKFARNVTFAAVDLAGVIRERPEEAAAVQREAMSLVMNGAVHAPRPISTYSMAELETAMRTMQTGRHMGKLVIRPRLDDMVRVLPPKLERASFHADASYLLIGGLGGIGRAWAKRMIHLGARHLIFMSPSGTRKPAAKAALDELQAQEGLATTRVFECDVSSRDDLSTALSQIADLPPIKGVFHCASNYTGDLFANTTQEGWMAGLRPKVHATWNLHELLPLDMDHFVFLSSATSIAGNTGQAAYSAASAFQDAFADWRNNALGLPAVSIDLGMVAGVGHVAEHADIRRSLLSQGYAAIPEEECMAIIEAAVTQSRREGRCGNVVMGLNAPEGADSLARRTATMSHVRRDVGGRQDAGGRGDASGGARGSGGSARVRDLLKKATTLDEVERHVADALLAKMCGLLMVPTTDVDVGKPMNHYGLDSLIAVVCLLFLLHLLISISNAVCTIGRWFSWVRC